MVPLCMLIYNSSVIIRDDMAGYILGMLQDTISSTGSEFTEITIDK